MILNVSEEMTVSLWCGNKLQVEITGSSHAPSMEVTMRNFPKEGFDIESLKRFLKRRKPTYSPIFTSRCEPDDLVFSCGVESGTIVADEVKVQIKNTDVNKNDYVALYGKPRPSHADLAAYYKDGRLDFSGGGEFSGRLTAPMCVAGGICKQFLKTRGIEVVSYISSIGKISGKSYKDCDLNCFSDIKYQDDFPSLSNSQEMIQEIENAKNADDSVGGCVDFCVFGINGGVGGALFDGFEGKIANLLYSVPGVKGVEFGDGFLLSQKLGSKANDEIAVLSNGKIVTLTNRSGGINGGVTNGMPITGSVAFRPTPSIAKEQKTVDLTTKMSTVIKIGGRHDACVAVRAVPVIEAVVSLAILDSILG